MNHWKFLRSVVVASLVLGSCGVGSSPLLAEEGVAPDEGLVWQELHQKTELKKPVSVESARQPLNSVLAEAGKQTGVELVLSPELAQANKLIIIRANEMPLCDFMAAVARTYVAQWHNTGENRYELRQQNGDEIDVTFAQIGTPLFYRYRESGLQERARERGALYDQIVGELGQQNLNTHDGVAVNTLSGETLAQLRKVYEQQQAISLLMKRKNYTKALSSNFLLRIKSSPSEILQRYQHLNFSPETMRKSVGITFELLDENKEHLPMLGQFERRFSYSQVYGPPEQREAAE